MSKIQSRKRQKPKTIYQQQTEGRKPHTVNASETRPETWTRSQTKADPESIPGRNESRKPPEICRPKPPESYPQSTRTAPANFSKNHPSIFPIFKNFQKFFGRSGDTKNIGGGIKKPCIIFSHVRKIFQKIFPNPQPPQNSRGYKIFLQTSQIMKTDAITTHYSLTDADRWGIQKFHATTSKTIIFLLQF